MYFMLLNIDICNKQPDKNVFYVFDLNCNHRNMTNQQLIKDLFSRAWIYINEVLVVEFPMRI